MGFSLDLTEPSSVRLTGKVVNPLLAVESDDETVTLSTDGFRASVGVRTGNCIVKYGTDVDDVSNDGFANNWLYSLNIFEL